MIDIVLPKKNEEELIAMAQKLGYKELMFLYTPEDFGSDNLPESKLKLTKGILLDSKSLLRNPQKYRKHFVAVPSSDKDREVLETKSCSLLFDLELQPRRDFMHHRASGFNHILAQLAHDSKTTIGFSLASLLHSDNKGIILGRMMQNIGLCKKYKVNLLIGSFAQDICHLRSRHDVTSFSKLIGLGAMLNKILLPK